MNKNDISKSINFNALKKYGKDLAASFGKKSTNEKIVMQVNTFVPHHMQFQPLKKHTLNRYAQDYLQLENKMI
jgi:hypothetical protein